MGRGGRRVGNGVANAGALAPPRRQKKHQPRPSFKDTLKTAISKKGVTLPVRIKVSETELDRFLKKHGEDLHIGWRFWDGNFIVEELNSREHEAARYQCLLQLAAADNRVRGLSAGLSPTLVAPEGYDSLRQMKPDACIWNTTKKVSHRQQANGMAANEAGYYYPSVVVEVGFSQTRESLRNKVEAWFQAGNDRTGVRCVIEINIDDSSSPPNFLQFWVHKRGQARSPSVTTVRYDDYAANPANPRYQKVIPAADVCYPTPAPMGYHGVTINFGVIYGSLPGMVESNRDVSSSDEDDDGDGSGEDDDENNDEDENELD